MTEMQHPDHIANSAEAQAPDDPARDFPDWRNVHKHEIVALEKRVVALEAAVARLNASTTQTEI